MDFHHILIIIYYYIINNVSYSYTISEGSYSALDLVSSLTGNLNGLVISFNTINNKFTFTHTTYDFTLNFITSNCYQEFGFYSGIIYSSTSKSLSSACGIDLS